MKNVSQTPLIILPGRPSVSFTVKGSDTILDGSFIGHDFIHYPESVNEHPYYYSYKDIESYQYDQDLDDLKLKNLYTLLNNVKYDSKIPVTCIYHAGCSDGLMSAAVVKKFFKNHEVNFVEGRHGESINVEDYKNQLVLIVDFSFDTDILQALSKLSYNLIVLDHHKTLMDKIQEDYDNLNDLLTNSYIVVSDLLSGCGLTHTVLFSEDLLPEAVKYIQDADVWTWTQLNSKLIVPAIYFYVEKDFDKYYDLLVKPFDYQYLLNIGTILQKQSESHVKEIVKSTYQVVNYRGYRIGIVNCNSIYASLAGHYVLEHKDVDFALVYRFTRRGVLLSFRSDELRPDVSIVAQETFNGGGHRNAAGGSVDIPTFTNLILNNIVKE